MSDAKIKLRRADKYSTETIRLNETFVVIADEGGSIFIGEEKEVIEHSAYEALKTKHEELLSYLPKVPTQAYEKDLAKEVLKLKEENEVLRRGLEFYAARENYIGHSPVMYENKILGAHAIKVRGGVFDDDGGLAREALAEADKIRQEMSE